LKSVFFSRAIYNCIFNQRGIEKNFFYTISCPQGWPKARPGLPWAALALPGLAEGQPWAALALPGLAEGQPWPWQGWPKASPGLPWAPAAKIFWGFETLECHFFRKTVFWLGNGQCWRF